MFVWVNPVWLKKLSPKKDPNHYNKISALWRRKYPVTRLFMQQLFREYNKEKQSTLRITGF